MHMSVTRTKKAKVDKSHRIIEDVRSRLLSKEVRAGDKIATIATFARTYGMDRRTVRKIVDGMVQEGILENKHGVGLVAAKKAAFKLVEVVLPGVAGELMWWQDVVRGVKSVARQYDIDVLIRDAEADLQNDIDLVKQLPQSPAQAAVIISIHNKAFSQTIVSLANSGYPFVLVDENPTYADIDWVNGDHYMAGYKVAEKMVALGHKNIGIVTSTHISSMRNALDGFRDAINDAGIAFNRKYMIDMAGMNTLLFDKKVIDLLRKVLELDERPTAMYFPFAGYAKYCLELIRSLGLCVPEDISIVGSGPDCRETALDKRISGMMIDGYGMGQQAMRLLLGRFGVVTISSETDKSLFAFNWVDGESLGPARQY